MPRRRHLTAAVAALALSLSLASCGLVGGHGSPEDSVRSALSAGGRAADVAFAHLMIPHHQQALEMADLAATRAGSEQVLALAEQISAAQDPEIEQMRSWLTAWGAPLVMPGATAADGSMDHSGMDMGGMTSEGMMTAEDLTRLEQATGAEFDRLWLRLMVAHHEGAITMAEQILSTTSDARVKALAEAVVAGQEAEITRMRTLLGE